VKGLPARFVESSSIAAVARAEPREAQARKIFADAGRDALVHATSLEAIRKYKGLLAEHAVTGFVRRNRASIANRAAELGRDYFFVAGDMMPSGCFTFGQNAKARVDPCWICDRELDASARETSLELSFGALPDAEYRCWVYAGGCCLETLSFLAQTTDAAGPLPVKIPSIGLKAKHSQHTGPKEPDRWTWVPIPLPKSGAAEVRTIRLFTTRKGFGLAYAVVTSQRAAPPRDAEIKDLERSRASAPPLNPLPADDLVAYWKFDEGSGTTVADSSGRGHMGQFRGDATWGPGRSGTGLVLAGNDGYVEVADSADFAPPSITIAMWINLPVAPPNYGNLLSKGGNQGYRFRAEGGGILRFLDRGRENMMESTSPVPLRQWTHAAATADATGLRIYVNGKLAGSNSAPFGAPPSSSTLKIGAEPEFKESVVGTINEVCVYKKALSSAEVQALYRLGPKLAAK
jgi:hypothetical protein